MSDSQLSVVKDLIALGETVCSELESRIPGAAEGDERDRLVLFFNLLKPSSERLKAILVLIDREFLSEARALARSIFDANMNFFYALENPDVALLIFQRAHYASWMKIVNRISNKPNSEGVDEDIQMLEQGRRDIDIRLAESLTAADIEKIDRVQRNGSIVPDQISNIYEKRLKKYAPDQSPENIDEARRLEQEFRNVLSADVHLARGFQYSILNVHVDWFLDRINDYFSWMLAWSCDRILHIEPLMQELLAIADRRKELMLQFEREHPDQQ